MSTALCSTGDYNGSQGCFRVTVISLIRPITIRMQCGTTCTSMKTSKVSNSTGTSLEADKIRLGVAGQPGPFPTSLIRLIVVLPSIRWVR